MQKVKLRSSFLGLALFFSIFISGQAEIAEGFFDQGVAANFTLPVGITFDHNGVGYVREKAGRVFAIDPVTSERTLILDISEEVGSWADHGFTGFAFDPDFEENGYLYAAYTVDRYHLFNYGKPDYDPDSTILTNATIGRVSRFSFDLSTSPISYIPGSKKILMGKDLTDGFPILADLHGVGTLAFGNDGTLLVSCGDSGLDSEPGFVFHTEQALKDGIIDSTLVIGSYRSQSLYSVNGKLLRINKETGDGLPSNPFFQEEDPRSSHSRIWSIGLRNPYKIMHMPGSGSHNPDLGNPGKFIIGDVGTAYWEEFNLASEPAQNFGWPIYEGHIGAWPYGFLEIENIHAPNPYFDPSSCNKPFFWYNELIKQDNEARSADLMIKCDTFNAAIPESIRTYVHTRPFIYYSNKQWNKPRRSYVPGYGPEGEAIEIPTENQIEGFSALPGDWYESGSFPDSFYQTLIVSDYSGWIKAFRFDDNYQLDEILDIRSNINGIVDVKLNPIDDCLYYVNIFTGQLRKICFGGNPPPVAIAKADQLYGGNNLTVNFDASESYDPNQLPFTVKWDFGDGTTSEEMKVSHTFSTNGSTPVSYPVILSVTDSLGEVGIDSLEISLNNTPPIARITSPVSNTKYSINGYNRLDLKAEVSDAEEGIDNLKYNWQIHLHHNLHYHSEEPVSKKSFSALIEPIGCAEKDIYWFRVSLEVTDSYGLSSTDEVLLYPYCAEYPLISWDRFDSGGNNIQLNWNINEPVDKVIVQKINDAGDIMDLGLASNNTFTDENPIMGENRYRLQAFKDDGYFYSSEKSIDFPLVSLSTYPNPVSNGKLNIELEQHLGEKVEISIISSDGKLLLTKDILEPSGEDLKVELSVGDFPKGIYILKVENDNRVFHERFEVIK